MYGDFLVQPSNCAFAILRFDIHFVFTIYAIYYTCLCLVHLFWMIDLNIFSITTPPNFWVCAWWKVLANRFKICYISSYVYRNPTLLLLTIIFPITLVHVNIRYGETNLRFFVNIWENYKHLWGIFGWAQT